MCKIIPSPATLTLPTQSTQLAQDFDAWFETLNRELSMGKDCQPDYMLSPLSQPEPQRFADQQFPFDMQMSLANFPSSPDYANFSLPSPASVEDIRAASPVASVSPLSIMSPTKKENVTLEYVSRPTKANNVKRSSPDDPITEEVARKRQKQNEAAKKCRQKRISQLQECQQKVEQSEKEKFELSVRLAVLEKEKEAWILKEKEMNLRMERLRAQLDQAHQTLMTMK